MLKDSLTQLRIAGRLMRDSRVPAWTKIIPLLTIGYVVSPIDFIPDAFITMFGLGAADDIAAVLLGLKMFMDMAPQHVVAEHRAAVTGIPQDGDWDVVDADYEISDNA